MKSEAKSRDDQGPLRLDKWLWAARFFKTRSLACDAVDGGKVHLNGQRVKPSRDVKAGDELRIMAGEQTWTVIVRGLSHLRGPAAVARLLYEETAESAVARQTRLAEKQFIADPATEIHGRPTKRDRRQLDRWR